MGQHLDAPIRDAASRRTVHADRCRNARYKITVEDPATFSSPWTAVIPISRLADDTRIYEYACHEGNYAMPNLLSAGRAVAAKQRSSN